eukprot:GSA25T00000252001.1
MGLGPRPSPVSVSSTVSERFAALRNRIKANMNHKNSSSSSTASASKYEDNP